MVIPVKNGADTIAACLDGISKQKVDANIEVIIIDSGSSDNSLDIVRKYPHTKVISINPESFNHGLTRNLGVANAVGDFIVMTVQDAAPADEFWLENMFRHFEDPEVSGVCGQQVVPHHKDKNPHEWFRPQSKPNVKVLQYKLGEFEKLTGEQQRSLCGWDDVNAMYRKKALQEIPFEPVMFGEDMLWAKSALLKGYKLVYDTHAQVEHYHHHTPSYTYNRTLIVLLFIFKTFGFVRKDQTGIKDYLLVVYRNIKWKLPLKWITHNWSLIYTLFKANRDFNRYHTKRQIDRLEAKFAGNIPLGQSKTSK